MTERKALGRGLSSLLPETPQPSRLPERAIVFIAIEAIEPNPKQPRKRFSPGELEELADSIRQQGVLQPIVVRKKAGIFEIVAGERRWRAAQKAGLQSVPTIVRELSDIQVLEIALVENIQRQDLNPLEEASAYQQLIDEFGLTQESLAKRVGKERSTVANLLRLLTLTMPVQQLLLDGKLSMGHARALATIEGERQWQAATRVVKEGLSVRATEQLAATLGKIAQDEPPAASGRSSPQVRHLSAEISRLIGSPAEIKPGRKGGYLSIRYVTNDDLSRIIDILKRGQR